MHDLKADAKHIFLSTLRAVDIGAVIQQRVRLIGDWLEVDGDRIDLSSFKEVVIVGFGKASLKMGAAMESILGERITKGILVSSHPPHEKTACDVVVAGHPLPDYNSLIAGKSIFQLLESCTQESLIVFLISGGGSSLIEYPLWDEVTLEDIRQLNKTLISCGASIREINTIRKHLSRIKGGRLGYLVRHCRTISLYVSDVNPGDTKAIASNPLMPDELGLADFFSVIQKYSLADRLPESIARNLEKGRLEPLPRNWQNDGSHHINALLLENRNALSAAAKLAEDLGYAVTTDYQMVEGYYRPMADKLIELLLDMRTRTPDNPVCIVSGGEASCPVRGDGIGGRNQEFVLYSAMRLLDLGLGRAVVVLSCGTDGIDGNSTAAGAVADAELIANARSRGADLSGYLERNDSNSFFKEFGGLIKTGPTENNIRDVRILLASSLK